MRKCSSHFVHAITSLRSWISEPLFRGIQCNAACVTLSWKRPRIYSLYLFLASSYVSHLDRIPRWSSSSRVDCFSFCYPFNLLTRRRMSKVVDEKRQCREPPCLHFHDSHFHDFSLSNRSRFTLQLNLISNPLIVPEKSADLKFLVSYLPSSSVHAWVDYLLIKLALKCIFENTGGQK